MKDNEKILLNKKIFIFSPLKNQFYTLKKEESSETSVFQWDNLDSPINLFYSRAFFSQSPGTWVDFRHFSNKIYYVIGFVGFQKPFLNLYIAGIIYWYISP